MYMYVLLTNETGKEDMWKYIICAGNSRTLKPCTLILKDIIEMERLWNLFVASTFIYIM